MAEEDDAQQVLTALKRWLEARVAERRQTDADDVLTQLEEIEKHMARLPKADSEVHEVLFPATYPDRLWLPVDLDPAVFTS